MSEAKYVAYVGSYTHGKAKGITICDVDVEKGIFIPRKEVEVGNPSYLRIANNGKYLYSVSDLGISAFKILPDGDLEFMNLGTINGMRACHISVDKSDEYIFTAGYHDGKVSHPYVLQPALLQLCDAPEPTLGYRPLRSRP